MKEREKKRPAGKYYWGDVVFPMIRSVLEMHCKLKQIVVDLPINTASTN